MDLAQKIEAEMKSLDEAIQEGLGVEKEEPVATAPADQDSSNDDDEAVTGEQRVVRAARTLAVVMERLRSSVEDAYQASVSLMEVLGTKDKQDEPEPGEDSSGEDDSEGERDEVSEES